LRLAIVLIVFGVFRAEALGQTFTYDSNGNLTTRTEGGVTTEYLYDIRNLLAEVRQGSQVLARFAYDSEGRLIQKIGNDGIRQYAYDGPRVLAEYDHNGTLVARFRYAGDELTAVTWVIEGRRWVSTDGLGYHAYGRPRRCGRFLPLRRLGQVPFCGRA
jgi:YD repeat-containing protein